MTEIIIIAVLAIYAICISLYTIYKHEIAARVQLTLEQTAGRYNESEKARKATADIKNALELKLNDQIAAEQTLRKDAEKETEKLLRDIRTATTIKDLKKRYKSV